MKIKTSEATPLQLDWLICKAAEVPVQFLHGVLFWAGTNLLAAPSSNWSQGGPIIAQEKVSTYYMPGEVGGAWRAEQLGRFLQAGPTPLVAAMRCYVASKLGNEVEVPEGLK